VKKTLLAAAAALSLAGCGCIAAGSTVLTPRGRRRIESLQPGDEVICLDPATGERVTSLVATTRSLTRETLRLSGEGWSLRCTSDHPLYDPSTREWAPAGDWVLGKRSALLLVTDEPTAPRQIAVDARALDAGLAEVFDISVAHELHNFIAEGILVHNKSPIIPSCTFPDAGTVASGASCTCANGTTGFVSCEDGNNTAQCTSCR
jgi:hypothetical protein